MNSSSLPIKEKTPPLLRTLKIFEDNEILSGCFRYNDFSHDIEYRRAPVWDSRRGEGDPVNDEDFTFIRYYLSRIYNFEPSKHVVLEACLVMGHEYRYHPVKKYIETVDWDGAHRIDKWLINVFGCDDNIYTRLASRKILVAAVNRVYKPGCKFDHMMILEGAQGIGKSTAIEELAGEHYVDTTLDQKDKDLVDVLRRGFLVEISELTGLNKRENDWLKTFIARKKDVIRLPYAARAREFPRCNVFIGTCNPSGNNTYLRDDTGNRRYWPIECRFGNLDYIKEHKHQLWAEALEFYKQNETYYIHEAPALRIMRNMHADRELESPTTYKIESWLREQPRGPVHINNIIEDALGIKISGKPPAEMASISTTVGIILRKLQWVKGVHANRQKYYPPNDWEYLPQIKQVEVWND